LIHNEAIISYKVPAKIPAFTTEQLKDRLMAKEIGSELIPRMGNAGHSLAKLARHLHN
jgi:hypothetical protein